MSTAVVDERRARRRSVTFLLIAVLIVVAAIPIAALWEAFGPNSGAYAPDFTLTDQDGRPFTLSSLRGDPVVLFFGYTHCPDTCPTTLAHLTRALRAPGVPSDEHVAFVTVDPARDSPPVLKRYVRIFDPRFIGLTGTAAVLAPIYAAYHTWREDVPVHHGPHDDYSVAHGAAIYFIGRNGTVRGFGSWDDDMPTMVRELQEFR
jgi:protein SCO1/2